MIFLIILLLIVNAPIRPSESDIMLTVIIPCWQCDRWLSETIASIAKQTILDSIEVILVDDGNPQPVMAELRSLPRARTIRHYANSGLSAARNTGAKNAKAPFIVFLDPDDLISPYALERLLIAHIVSLRRQRVRPIAWTYPSVTHINEKGNTVLYRSGSVFDPSLLLSPTNTMHAPPSFAIISRGVYLSMGGMCEKKIKWWEDLEFWCRLHRSGYSGSWWPEDDLFFYRRHQHSGKDIPEVAGRVSAIRSHPDCARQAQAANNEKRFFELPRKAHAPCDVLFVIPWMRHGGADDYDLEVIRICHASMRLKTCIVTTEDTEHSQEIKYRQYTEDIWKLKFGFEDKEEYLDYIVETRSPAFVWVRNTRLGYLLSQRYSQRGIRFIDILHLDTPHDQLGFEHTSRPFKDYLARRVFISDRLNNMMNDASGIVIRPPLNTTLFRCPMHSRRKGIIFVGRNTEQKRPDIFVRLCKTLPDLPCTLITDTPIPGHGNVTQLKWMRKEQLAKALCSAGILVLTSSFEGIPMVGLQARACGLTVISLGRIGAINEIPGVIEVDTFGELVRKVQACSSQKQNNSSPHLLENMYGMARFERDVASLFQVA